MKTSILVGWLTLSLACGGESEATIELERPYAGEVLVAGTRQPIQWRADGATQTVDIWLLGPDGISLRIAEKVDGTSFTWEVPIVRALSRGDFSIRIVPSGVPPGASARSAFAISRAAAAGEPVGEADGLSMGSFAAVHWNETDTVEEYYWINSISGDTVLVGTVGDLATLPWPAPLAADNTAKRVFVIGMDGANAQKVYTLDSLTGDLVTTSELTDGMPDAVTANAAGELLGFRWSGSVEEVVRVEPDTGAQEVIGTVGDLETWTAELTVGVDQDRLYVAGMPAGGGLTLYTLVSTTGELLESAALTLDGVPLDELLGLAVNSEGAVLGFRWSGTVEQMLQIEPSTGETTVLGTVGDLEMWSTVSALNLSNDNLYVIGNNGTADKLYVLDARTSGEPPVERLLYDTPVEDYPTSALLVY